MNLSKRLLIPIFITICLDFISLGVLAPVMGPLILSSNQILGVEVSSAQRTIVMGWLVGAFPLAAFFGAPIMGALSDKYGRKKIINFSLIINCFCYSLLAIGITISSLPLIFISRLIAGFFGATVNTCVAAMVDITNPKERVKNFGLIGVASFACGFILGPIIASFYTNTSIIYWFNPATPFWFIAAWCITNLLIVKFFLKETLKEKSNENINLLTGVKNIYKALTVSKFRTIFLVAFLITAGFNFFAGYIQIFLIQKFDYDTAQIANIFIQLGVWMALTQGLILRIIPKRITPETVLLICLPLVAIFISLIALPSNSQALYYILPFISIFQGLAWPYSSAVISNAASDSEQGEMLGINASLQALAQTIPPILSGFIAVVNFNLPILIGGSCALIAWFIFLTTLKIRPSTATT